MPQLRSNRRLLLLSNLSCCAALLSASTQLPLHRACLLDTSWLDTWSLEWAGKAYVFPVAQDFLTEMNSPDGACPICLLPLAAGNGSRPVPSMAAEQPVKLQCYHCMHRCLTPLPGERESSRHKDVAVVSLFCTVLKRTTGR